MVRHINKIIKFKIFNNYTVHAVFLMKINSKSFKEKKYTERSIHFKSTFIEMYLITYCILYSYIYL